METESSGFKSCRRALHLKHPCTPARAAPSAGVPCLPAWPAVPAVHHVDAFKVVHLTHLVRWRGWPLPLPAVLRSWRLAGASWTGAVICPAAAGSLQQQHSMQADRGKEQAHQRVATGSYGVASGGRLFH